MAAGGQGEDDSPSSTLSPLEKKEQGALRSSETLSGSTAQREGPRIGNGDAAEDRGSRSDCKGVTARKEKALYFPSILPGRKRKLPKRRLQCLIAKQGIWFELAESTPPPSHTYNTHTHTHTHTRLAQAQSSPRKSAQPQPSALQPWLRIPALQSQPAGTLTHPARRGAPRGRTRGRGQFCAPAWGRSKEGAELEAADRSSTAPSGWLNH